MTARSNRRRNKARRKPVFDGDFPDSDETITELIAAAGPADYDGRTYTLGGASELGLPPGEAHRVAAVKDAIEMTAMAERGTAPRPQLRALPAPVAAGEPQALPLTGRGWTMTVNTGGPGIPWNDRLRAARAWLGLKVDWLESEGMGYRIDDAEELRQRGEKLDGRSIIARAGKEGTAHLLGPRPDWLTRNSGQPWEPAGGWETRP
jgi:hypothetical protein